MKSEDKQLNSKVSIIVPVYKAEDYLSRCIDSILNQSHLNIELILVNDGSPDNSGSICDNYAEKDDRVIVIHQKNMGVSMARNAGIDMATGEYLQFVDSDDYLDPHMTEQLVGGINTTHSDLVICGVNMVTDPNRFEDTVVRYSIPLKTYNVRDLLESLFIEYPLIIICGPWNKLFRTKIIKENKIKFDPNLSLGEDTVFNTEVLRRCRHVYGFPGCSYNYIRVNNDSLFSKYNPEIFGIHKIVYSKVRALYEQYNCSQNSKNRFEQEYLHLILGCIYHLFEHGKESTLKEKMAKVGQITSDSQTQTSISVSNESTLKIILVRYLIKHRHNRLIILLYSANKLAKSLRRMYS